MRNERKNWTFSSYVRSLVTVSSALLICLTVPEALCARSTTEHAAETTGKKVEVDIYMESLCRDTINFYSNQLQPSYNKIKECANIRHVPFGKASYKRSNGRLTFECQHGAKECAGNKVMACALDALAGSQDDQTAMMVCMFAHKTPHLAGEDCANKLGFDWSRIQTCSEGPEGDELLAKHGDKTLAFRPKINFIPWITINGARSKAGFKNFAKAVCNASGGCC